MSSLRYLQREASHHLGWMRSALRWSGEEVPTHVPLWDFSAPSEKEEEQQQQAAQQRQLASWVVTADGEEGGLSSCDFQLRDEASSNDSSSPARYASFSGRLRVDAERARTLAEVDEQQRLDAGEELPEGGALPGEKTRAFCSVRTEFPRENMDLSEFTSLELWLRMDHNPYVVNVRAHTLVPDDLYQGFLPPAPLEQRGDWLRFELPFERFVLTSFGYEKALEREMDTQRMQTLGFTVMAEEDTDFRLDIALIAATGAGSEVAGSETRRAVEHTAEADIARQERIARGQARARQRRERQRQRRTAGE